MPPETLQARIRFALYCPGQNSPYFALRGLPLLQLSASGTQGPPPAPCRSPSACRGRWRGPGPPFRGPRGLCGPVPLCPRIPLTGRYKTGEKNKLYRYVSVTYRNRGKGELGEISGESPVLCQSGPHRPGFGGTVPAPGGPGGHALHA